MLGFVAGIMIGLFLLAMVVGLTFMYVRKLLKIKHQFKKHNNLTEEKEESHDSKSSHHNEV